MESFIAKREKEEIKNCKLLWQVCIFILGSHFLWNEKGWSRLSFLAFNGFTCLSSVVPNSCYYSWTCRQSFFHVKMHADKAYGSTGWKTTHLPHLDVITITAVISSLAINKHRCSPPVIHRETLEWWTSTVVNACNLGLKEQYYRSFKNTYLSLNVCLCSCISQFLLNSCVHDTVCVSLYQVQCIPLQGQSL